MTAPASEGAQRGTLPRALASPPPFAYDPAPIPEPPGLKGCRGGFFARSDANGAFAPRRNFKEGAKRLKESQMPKLKTKSGAKKRFKITGTGKVVYVQRGKRHGMIKRTTKQIRNLRGTAILFKTDGDNVKKFFLPNG
jgi:large subunit ribosomal protein L35